MDTQRVHVVCQSSVTARAIEFDITVDQAAPDRLSDVGAKAASSIAAVFVPGSRVLVFLSPTGIDKDSLGPSAMAGIIPVSDDGTVVPFDPRIDGVGLGGSTGVADVLSVVEANGLNPV